jgi:hypothetical protein
MKVGRWTIHHGDTVRFRAQDGSERNGRANGLLLFATHAVLDMGGAHGRPQVVQADHIVMVIPRHPR